jgi:von Willebrand factor type A domain
MHEASSPTSGPFPECVATGSVAASLRPPNLLFLIDRSSSMSCNPPPITSSADCERTPGRADTGTPSKWEIIRESLKKAIRRLPPNARTGITYFSNDDICGVQSQPSVPLRELTQGQILALTQSLDDAGEPRGGTPMIGGLILAYKYLNRDQTPEVPDGNRFVVLVTDGQEDCAPGETFRLLQIELPKSRVAGITTFVIGVPGSESNRGFLSQLAFAGGTPARPDCIHEASDPSVGDCQFDMTRDLDLASGLARALTLIDGEALRCEFDVPQPTNGEELDYDLVNIVYTDVPNGDESVIAQDATAPCENANGWQYSGDRTKIVLCGSACETVRHAAGIRIAIGCKTAILL